MRGVFDSALIEWGEIEIPSFEMPDIEIPDIGIEVPDLGWW